MSSIAPPPPPPPAQPAPPSPYGSDPKAAAAAAKAYAKAQRPWFKKKRFIIPLVLVGLVVVVSAMGGGDETKPGQPNAGGTKTAGPETASGNTANPPQADLHDDFECATDALGWVIAKGTLTNNSSETSSYIINVSFNDAAGTRFAEGIAFHNDIRSGESAVWEAMSGSDPSGDGWTCEVISVERFAS